MFYISKLTSDLLIKLPGATSSIKEKFFKSFEEIVKIAEEYDLILLPLRLVLSDVLLIVLELSCSGASVETTIYSHVTKFSHNPLILGINKPENADRIGLASLAKELHDKHYRTIM